MNSLFLSIDYIEFEGADTYKAVEARLGPPGTDKEVRRFATGDVTADWKAALDWGRPQAEVVLCSSTVDHFTSDSDGAYEWIADPQYGDVPVRATPIPPAFLAAFA